MDVGESRATYQVTFSHRNGGCVGNGGGGCNDDAIHVMGERLAASPVLKCKQQRGVR